MGQLPEKGRPGVGQAPKKSPKLALRDYLAFIPLLPPGPTLLLESIVRSWFPLPLSSKCLVGPGCTYAVMMSWASKFLIGC